MELLSKQLSSVNICLESPKKDFFCFRVESGFVELMSQNRIDANPRSSFKSVENLLLLAGAK
jgi:hypothetical protein